MHALRRALGQERRRSDDRLDEGGLRVVGAHQARHRRLLAWHRDVGHEWHHARPPAAARRQAGHARGRELLRDRVRSHAQRRVRRGERRVRRRDGDRRREGQGLRLPGPRRCVNAPTDGTARSLTAAAMFAMCAPAYGKKYGVANEQIREVLARIAWKNHYNGARNPRAQFRKEVRDGDDLQRAADGGQARCVRLLRRGRRFGRRDHLPRRGRAQVHRQADLHQGAVVRGRQLLGQRRPRLRLHVRSPRSNMAGKDAYAQAGITNPASRSRWPRCTTASRRPSS